MTRPASPSASMTSDRRPNEVSVADAALFLNITERAVKAAARAGAVPFRYAGPEMVMAVEDLLDLAARLVFEPSHADGSVEQR